MTYPLPTRVMTQITRLSPIQFWTSVCILDAPNYIRALILNLVGTTNGLLKILAAQFDVSGPTLTASLAAVQKSTGSIGTSSFTRGDLRLNSVVRKCFKKCLVVVLSGSNGFKLCICRITSPEQDLQRLCMN